MLDIKRLRYLEAVYRCRNFTRASEELFVSQPAISAAISSLEKDLKVKLVVRTPKEVTFTLEGERFMSHALRILRECREAEELMEDLSGTGSRTLCLGVSPTLGGQLLPLIYSDFLPARPGAILMLDEGSMANHIEKIQNDILDLSYNGLPTHADPAQLRLFPITSVEICAVMNPDHPLAVHDTLPITALEGQPIVLLDTKSIIRRKVMAELESNGVVPKVVSCHEQIISMINMIHLGNCIGFLNVDSSHRAMGCEGLAIRSFSVPISFDTGYIARAGKHLPPFARQLIDYTRQILAPLDKSCRNLI